MFKLNQTKKQKRLVAALAGAAMLGLGLAPMLHANDVVYENWFGGLVFSPIAVFLGAFTFCCAVL